MHMSSQSTTCSCKLHQQLEVRMLEARRHACYRQLAHTILGPDAPRDDRALARALADHAKLLAPIALTNLLDRRAA
jgi:hypothetical protein